MKLYVKDVIREPKDTLYTFIVRKNNLKFISNFYLISSYYENSLFIRTK